MAQSRKVQRTSVKRRFEVGPSKSGGAESFSPVSSSSLAIVLMSFRQRCPALLTLSLRLRVEVRQSAAKGTRRGRNMLFWRITPPEMPLFLVRQSTCSYVKYNTRYRPLG